MKLFLGCRLAAAAAGHAAHQMAEPWFKPQKTVFFFSLWLFGFIGGGDVKLISVFVVGIAPQFTVLTVCMVGILGGLQLGVAYMLQQQPFSRGVPYGVPIVLSGLAFTFLSNYSLVKYVV